MRRKIAIFISIYLVTLGVIFAATSLSTISADTTTQQTSQKTYVVYSDDFVGPLPANGVHQSDVKPNDFIGPLAPGQIYQSQITGTADKQGNVTQSSTNISQKATTNVSNSGANSSTGTSIFGTDLDSWMSNFYVWSVAVGGSLAVIVIIWAGYEYATSAGEVEKINKAKEKIIGAVLGLILLVLVALILNAVGSRGAENPFKGVGGSSGAGGANGASGTNNSGSIDDVFTQTPTSTPTMTGPTYSGPDLGPPGA